MAATQSRPLGVTLVASVVILQGVVSILVGLNLSGTISVFDAPTGGSASATGAGLIVAGILGIVVGAGLFTMKFWAYVVALFVLGMTVLAGIFALIQFGLDVENLPSLIPALISAVVFAYLFSERVRPIYDPD